MMEDSEYLNSCTAQAIDNPMAVADQAAESVPPRGPRFTTLREVCQAAKSPLDIQQIGIGGSPAELRIAIFADFHQIGASRPAQDDISHVERDGRRRFP